MPDNCTLCKSEMNRTSKSNIPIGIMEVSSKIHGVLYRATNNEIICGHCSNMIYDTPNCMKFMVNNHEIEIYDNGLVFFPYEYKFTINDNVVNSSTSYRSIGHCISEAIYEFKCKTEIRD